MFIRRVNHDNNIDISSNYDFRYFKPVCLV